MKSYFFLSTINWHLWHCHLVDKDQVNFKNSRMIWPYLEEKEDHELRINKSNFEEKIAQWKYYKDHPKNATFHFVYIREFHQLSTSQLWKIQIDRHFAKCDNPTLLVYICSYFFAHFLPCGYSWACELLFIAVGNYLEYIHVGCTSLCRQRRKW